MSGVSYETYSPEFRDDVFVLNPNGTKNRVNPNLCLTEDSATQLVRIMTDAGYPCEVYEDYPYTLNGNFGFGADSLVPWLRFDDGTQANAGGYADFWTHGYTPLYAMNSAIRNYQWDSYTQGNSTQSPPSTIIPSQ